MPAATRVTEANPPLHGETAWIRKLDSELTAPLVADEVAIYAAHRDARLVAYATADGSELWSFPVPGQLDDSPVVAGDTVYASLRSGGLVALEARTGRVRWRSDTGQDILSGAMVVDGVVWVGGRSVMLAYDAETGERLGGPSPATGCWRSAESPSATNGSSSAPGGACTSSISSPATTSFSRGHPARGTSPRGTAS